MLWTRVYFPESRVIRCAGARMVRLRVEEHLLLQFWRTRDGSVVYWAALILRLARFFASSRF